MRYSLWSKLELAYWGTARGRPWGTVMGLPSMVWVMSLVGSGSWGQGRAGPGQGRAGK